MKEEIKKTIKSHFDQSPIKNRIIKGGKIGSYSDLSRFLALKSLEKDMKKIVNKKRSKKNLYTEKFSCAICRKLIEEYAKGNKSRVIKSWLSICCSCYRKIEKQVAKQENRITKLEENKH